MDLRSASMLSFAAWLSLVAGGCASQGPSERNEEERQAESNADHDFAFGATTIEAGSPEQSFLMHLIRRSADGGMMGEGQVATVYPFPCDDRFVLKVPKTEEQVIQRLKKQRDSLEARREEAARLQSLQWESYRLAAERGGGVVAPIKLFKFEGSTPFPYLIVQERAEAVVKSHLEQLVSSGQTDRAKAVLEENLKLRRQAIKQGFWEIVDNFTSNNGMMDRDGEMVQRLIDAGEMQATPPDQDILVRTSQTAVSTHLKTWSPELADWYGKRSRERLGQMTDEQLDELWNSEGPTPIEYPEAERALEEMAESGDLSSCGPAR